MTQAQLSIQEIFTQALEIESEDARLSFLDQACCGNEKVRRKVDALLAAHAQAGRFMEVAQETELTDAMSGITERPGTCIGPYKLREIIGEGGFGVVYVAEQKQPVSRKVALKIIKPGMDSRDIIARFEAERQALAMMDHPNVAKVLDAGTTDGGRPYFVMELVHGIPITEFCDEQSLTNRERLRLFIDVCRAVQHAHQKGIIHRDIKPSNIMVTMHDDQPIPKVIDFGVAKALSRKLTEKTVYTSYGQIVGTPMYMSPEQAQMSGLDLDTRSDIYSLGVLLYELLTGTTPFDKETIQNAGYDELRRIIREDDPPRPSLRISTLNVELLSTAADRRKVDSRRLRQSLRGELDWIVMKALEKNRGRRYESASQLAEDIERYLNDEPVFACPPSLGYRFRKFARRNRVALTTSSLVAIAMIVGTIVSASQAVRASASEREAGEQRNAAVINARRARESERIAKAERDAAIVAREKLRRVWYASEMNLIQPAWEDDNYRRVLQILENTRPRSGETDIRDFEWYYWNRQVHGPLATHTVSMPQVGTRRLLEDTLSPDGNRLAVQYYDRGQVSVAIWDVATRQEKCNFVLYPGSIETPLTAMIFSPDGTRLAIPQRQKGIIRIWDTRTGKQLFLMEDTERIFRIHFSGDGNRVLYTHGMPQDNRTPSDYGHKLWDLTTDQILVSRRHDGETFPNLVFLSRDGKQVGVTRRRTDAEGSHLQIWDVETSRVLQDRVFDQTTLFRALSPDGSRIALQELTPARRILIVNANSLKTTHVVLGDDGPAGTKVAFSPGGRFLAASTSTRKVLIWDLQSSSTDDRATAEELDSPLVTLRVPRSKLELRFSPDSEKLKSCIYSRVWTWALPLDTKSHEIKPWSNGAVIGGSFNVDGTRALLRAQPVKNNLATLLLHWDVSTDREIWRYRDPRGDRAYSKPVFCTDGKYVVVASRQVRTNRSRIRTAANDELHVLNGETGQLLRTFQPEGAYNIDNVVFSFESYEVAAIVTRRPDNEPASFEIVKWNVETGENVLAVQVEDEAPMLVGFTRSGDELLVARRSRGGVLVLDADTGQQRRIIAPEGTTLNRMGNWSLSPDGKTLAVLGLERLSNEIAVALYDAVTGKPGLRIPVDTKYPPPAMKWSPDGRRIALVSSQWLGDQLGAEVTLWDTETGRLVLTLSRLGLISNNYHSICFSPEGHRLLHISADNRAGEGEVYDHPSLHPIRIWDATPLTRNDMENH
jgi:serine/threonine protein kinase/WD40 repeat protein